VPGVLLFGVGLATLHVVSRVYLPARIEHSSALYGSLGVAGAMLVWLLATGQLMVGCAILNRVWLRHRDPRFDPDFDASFDSPIEPAIRRAAERVSGKSEDSGDTTA
jgi:membrane protein